jgi:sugar (pentulose or hexulose) kinase
MTFIALDLGTTFIKGALLDLDRLRISHIRRLPFPAALPGLPPLFHEVDPAVVTANVCRLIDELLAASDECAGIVFCTQMHGLVLCDEAGRAHSNMITWQDQRVLTPRPTAAGSYFADLQRLINRHEQEQLGNELQPSRPLCYLYWMAENGRLPHERLWPAALTDFVVANLCVTHPMTDPTNAGAYGALNLTTMDWHNDIVQRLGLDRLRWPEIRPFPVCIGELPIAGRLLPCYSPVGDHQCALVGAFLRQRQLSLNISTGSQVTLLTMSLQLGDYQTRPFFDGRFINTVTGVPAGRALNALVNLLTEIGRGQGIELADAWGYIAQAAGQVAETDLQVNLAFYDSLSGKQGHILNMREENISVGHLFRATFQNMADNYSNSALRLSPQGEWDDIVFSGGLAQKFETLRTVIQAKLAKPYRLCAASEDTLLGLLALALVASGRQPCVAAAIEELRESYRE